MNKYGSAGHDMKLNKIVNNLFEETREKIRKITVNLIEKNIISFMINI